MSANRDNENAELASLVAVLPAFIEMIQHRLAGNNEQAALSMLAAIPPGGDTGLMERYGPRIVCAIAIHGMDAVREAAVGACHLPAGAARTARIDELAMMLDTDHVDECVNEILGRIQQGEPPTQRDLLILESARDLYRA